VVCSVESLSAGGARIIGALHVAPGEHLHVTLASCDQEAYALEASVLRAQDRCDGVSAVALQFTRVAPIVHDAIQRLVARERARERAAKTWVISLDDERAIRAALDRELRVLGLSPRSVAAPLDLLRCLEDTAINVAAVIVDLRLCQEQGTNVLTFLSEDYPRIRRIAMSGTASGELERCVRSGWAHALLEKPWHRSDLVQALDIAP
jgi:CheY-like chemotaxis protein